MVADYQSGLRLREGSDVTLVASSSVPLGDVDVLLKTTKTSITILRWSIRKTGKSCDSHCLTFRAASTISIVPQDTNGISAQAPFRYFLGVVLDEPPELNIEIKGIGTSITPRAKLPVSATAQDDYGVTDLTVSLTPAAATTDADADQQAETNRPLPPLTSTVMAKPPQYST